MTEYGWDTGRPHVERVQKMSQGVSVPVDMHWDGDPTPEQKIRKWALELAVEWLAGTGASHTYLLDVAEKFELFVADGTMDK